MVRFIIINGLPGSGKTTTVKRLIKKDLLPKPYIYIQEYQMTDEGNTALKDYLSSRTNVVQFQTGAVDYYVKNIKPHINEDITIVLDKHPDIGLLLYTYIDLMDGKISQDEYNEIAKYHDKMFNGVIPRSMDGYIINNELDILPEVIRLINNHESDYLMIFLDVSIKTVKERIIQRGRDKEIEYYVVNNAIQKLANRYTDICSATLIIGDSNKSYIISNNILDPVNNVTKGDPVIIKRVVIDIQYISHFRASLVPTYVMLDDGNLVEIHDYYSNLLKVDHIDDIGIVKYIFNKYVTKVLRYPSMESMTEDTSYVTFKSAPLLKYGKIFDDVNRGYEIKNNDNYMVHLLRYYQRVVGFTPVY